MGLIPILYEYAINHKYKKEKRRRKAACRRVPHTPRSKQATRSVSLEKNTKKEVKRVWRSLTKKWYKKQILD